MAVHRTSAWIGILDIAEVPDALLALVLPVFLEDWVPFLSAVCDVLGDDDVVGDPPVPPRVPREVPAVAPLAPLPSSPSDVAAAPPAASSTRPRRSRRWGSLILFPYSDAIAAIANVQAGLEPPPRTTRSRSRRRRR